MKKHFKCRTGTRLSCTTLRGHHAEAPKVLTVILLISSWRSCVIFWSTVCLYHDSCAIGLPSKVMSEREVESARQETLSKLQKTQKPLDYTKAFKQHFQLSTDFLKNNFRFTEKVRRQQSSDTLHVISPHSVLTSCIRIVHLLQLVNHYQNSLTIVQVSSRFLQFYPAFFTVPGSHLRDDVIFSSPVSFNFAWL